MVGADAALPRVVGEVAALGPAVEGEDRVAAQRAVAHGRHVEEAGRVGPGAVRPADGRPQVGRLQVDGGQRVVHPFVADLVHVFLGAERQGVAFALGALIDERTLLAVERHAVGVVLDEVLVDFRADEFQEIAAVADDGKVAQHRVFGLEIIVQPERDNRPGQQPPPRAGRKHEKIDCARYGRRSGDQQKESAHDPSESRAGGNGPPGALYLCRCGFDNPQPNFPSVRRRWPPRASKRLGPCRKAPAGFIPGDLNPGE